MSVVVIHAYSRENRGDGLLVDLTLQLLARAGVPPIEVDLVAADPVSFSATHTRTLRAANLTGHRPSDLLRGLWSWRPNGQLAALIDEADLVVGVGGGYLRAGTPIEAAKTLIAHGPQFLAATRRSKPTVYLPQSVGPLPSAVYAWMNERTQSSPFSLHARDDLTYRALAGSGSTSVLRTPDLAVLEIGQQLLNRPPLLPEEGRSGWALVARDLPRAGGTYKNALHLLLSEVPNGVLGIQSRGRGNDDARWYQEQFPGVDVVDLREALPTLGAVVSVRLHGALQAVLASVPAIHLSYERKGFGAYGDLNLRSYVHQARTFDPQVVAAQLQALLRDGAGDYWHACEDASSALRQEYDHLVALVRNLLPTGQ
jgi:polysaccharide pyruvyl transferase WcaK-like protein